MTVPGFMGIDLSDREDAAGVIYMRDRQIVARETVATCAACGKACCDHSDLVFAGFAAASSAES